MQYEDKIKKIEKLLAEKQKIEAQLKELVQTERVVALPRGFSVSVEVSRIVQEAGATGVSSQEILQTLQKQYPDSIDREKVASALAYLKNTKKQVDQLARGVYVLVENKTS